MGEWCRDLVVNGCQLISEVAGKVISSQTQRREKNVLNSLCMSEVLLILFW